MILSVWACDTLLKTDRLFIENRKLGYGKVRASAQGDPTRTPSWMERDSRPLVNLSCQ